MNKIYFLIFLSTSLAQAAVPVEKSRARASTSDSNHLTFYLSPFQYQSDILSSEGDTNPHTDLQPVGLGVAWGDHTIFIDRVQTESYSGNSTLSVARHHQEMVLMYSYQFYRPQSWLALNAGFGVGFQEEDIESRLPGQTDMSRTGRQNLGQLNSGILMDWKVFYLGLDLKAQTSRDETPNPQFSWAIRSGLQFTIF